MIVALLAVTLLLRFVVHGPVDATRLAHSVVDHVGGTDRWDGPVRDCAVADSAWRCRVTGEYGHNVYLVTMRPDSSCWDARAVDIREFDQLPTIASGCVTAWQWSAWGTLDELVG